MNFPHLIAKSVERWWVLVAQCILCHVVQLLAQVKRFVCVIEWGHLRCGFHTTAIHGYEAICSKHDQNLNQDSFLPCETPRVTQLQYYRMLCVRKALRERSIHLSFSLRRDERHIAVCAEANHTRAEMHSVCEIIDRLAVVNWGIFFGYLHVLSSETSDMGFGQYLEVTLHACICMTPQSCKLRKTDTQYNFRHVFSPVDISSANTRPLYLR